MSPQLRYGCPETLDEGLRMLAETGPKARILAGGTDVVVALRRGETPPPPLLVDVTRIPGLTEITEEPDGTLRIGATVSHSRVSASPLVRKGAPVLAAASASVGSVQIRNLGTLGGNAVNAAVAADTLSALAVLRTHFEVAGLAGARRLSLDEFFLGPGRTAVGSGEILTAILVPQQPPHGACFLKVGRRRAAAISRLSVAVVANPASGLVRLSLGAVFPRPQRVSLAEEKLVPGFGPEQLEAAGRAAEDYTRGVSGDRPSMRYKLPVIRDAVVQALKKAVAAAGELDR
jgi:carbon-monoxide dehydrogenase medium subunit